MAGALNLSADRRRNPRLQRAEGILSTSRLHRGLERSPQCLCFDTRCALPHDSYVGGKGDPRRLASVLTEVNAYGCTNVRLCMHRRTTEDLGRVATGLQL